MGFVLEIGVQIRKSVRTCCRLLFHHPFLVAFLLFLTFLHRFFPFLFYLLVTASPVLVCSITLLGTLLIFGRPKLPKTKREKKISLEFSSLGAWGSPNEPAILKRNRRFYRGKFSGKSVDELSCSRYSSDPEGSVGYVPLVDETFHYTDSEKRELDSKELENQRVIHKEKLGINGKRRDVRALEKPASLKSDHSESSQDGGGGDDEASDSGSDRAGGLSPDASIADIFPILDELHPLLDLNAPLPVDMSPDDSGIESDRSNDGSNESDDDDTLIRSRGVEEFGVDYNDDDEEEAHDGKEDESKSAIKWTEDDQMNLRDLGNLELERNRCLENLMTRRRASQRDEKNLIELDTSENPFNITQISTTRHNPFDHSQDSYDDMGLPPIPGSAPSTYLPRRCPFDLLYETNEGNHLSPELKGDHVEQENATFLPTNPIFCRHQSLRPSRLGDAKQERQDLKWRPVFVPEQLASEGTSYCSFQGLPREASDSKLSSIPDTDSVSSREDLDERKFSERIKEAEVISNIYQASHLVNHKSHSSEDLDPLEMERPGQRHIQHDESETKLGNAENESESLPHARGLVIPMEPISIPTHLGPEAFEDKSSNRSSSSLSSEMDEESSYLRKDGSKIFVPFETEVQTMSGMVDDTQHKPPVYDASPTGSSKVLSLNSSSSDIQAETSEVVTVPSPAKMRVPSIEQTLYSELHGESIEKATLANEQIGATSHVHASVENERLFLTSSHSDACDDLPKNLNVEVAFVNSSPQFVSSKDKMPAEESNLSLSSVKDQPCFDDHDTHPEPHIVLLESKENSRIKDINSVGIQDPSLRNLSPVSAKSTSSEVIVLSNKASVVQEIFSPHTALEQVSEANKLPKPSNSKDESVVTGSDAVDSTVIGLSNLGTSIQETVSNLSPNQLSDANGGEQKQTSNAQDRSSNVETGAKGYTKENALSNTETDVKESAATSNSLKQVSEDIDPHLPACSNSKDGLTEVGTKTSSPNKASEPNDCVLPKPSSSRDGSTEFGTNANSSTEEIKSINTGTVVQEAVTTHSTPKEHLEDNVGELRKLSNPDGSADIHNTIGSTKDVALSSIGFGVQETAKTPAKQVSESDVSRLPKSSKDISLSNTGPGVQETVTAVKRVSTSDDSELPNPSKDELAKVATNDLIGSTTSLQETFPTHLKQVLPGSLSEPSKSKDASKKVEHNAVGSAKETASNITGAGISETVSTQNPTKEFSQANVGELPELSDAKDGQKEIETNAVRSTTEIALNNTISSVQEKFTIDQREVSEGNLIDLPKTSNSGDVQKATATPKQVSQGNDSELPKSSKDGSPEVTNAVDSINSVQDTTTEVSQLPTPSNIMHGSTEVRNGAADSTKKLTSTNTGIEVQDGITTYTAKQVLEGNRVKLPTPSHANDGSATEVGTNAEGSTKSLQETVTTRKQLSQANADELQNPLDLEDGSIKVSNTVNSNKSDQETDTKQVSECNVSELPKHSKDGSTEVGTNVVDSTKKPAPSDMGTDVQESISVHTENKVAEDSVGELSKSSNLKDEVHKVGVDAVGSTMDILSSNTESGVHKSIPTSEGDNAELPRPNSDGHGGEDLKPSISDESNAGELSKPTSPKEASAGESKKQAESKGWLWW